MADSARPSSLVKFMSEKDGGERGALHWHRAHEDGAPYRGNQRPLYQDAEYEKNVTRVGDPKNAVFDLDDEVQNKAYMSIQDKIVNKWANLIHIERMITTDSKIVYIEWVEWFMEDGKAPQQAPPGMNRV